MEKYVGFIGCVGFLLAAFLVSRGFTPAEFVDDLPIRAENCKVENSLCIDPSGVWVNGELLKSEEHNAGSVWSIPLKPEKQAEPLYDYLDFPECSSLTPVGFVCVIRPDKSLWMSLGGGKN